MFIESLQRDLAVCSYDEVEGFLAREPARWHVVSIREPEHPEAALAHAFRSHKVVFADVFSTEGALGHGPKPAHVEGILRFVERSAQEPLLIHCWAGRSRSTAVALVVIVKSLWDLGMDGASLVRTAISALLEARPVATPNHFVLRLGLETFLSVSLARTLSSALLQEPRIARNFAEWRISLND